MAEPQGLIGESSTDCIATVGAVVTASTVIGCIVKNSVLGSNAGDEEEFTRPITNK